MNSLPRDRVLALLSECTGDDIWSVDHCRLRRVPEAWIEQLSDAYESGYRSNEQTIYTDEGMTNQYHGVRDVDLAIALARSIGIQINENDLARLGRARLVRAIKDAVMEGDNELF